MILQFFSGSDLLQNRRSLSAASERPLGRQLAAATASAASAKARLTQLRATRDSRGQAQNPSKSSSPATIGRDATAAASHSLIEKIVAEVLGSRH